MTELERVITPGMRRDDVVSLFGEPFLEMDLSKGEKMIEFTRPLSPVVTDIDRFTVYLSNDLVTEVSPVIVQVTLPGHLSRNQPKEIDQSLGWALAGGVTNAVSMFVVGENQEAGTVLVDTHDFPRLGYRHPEPDIVLREIVGVEGGGSTRMGTEAAYYVIFRLSENEAEKLHRLSQAHLGKYLLVVIDEKPVAAPVIRTPLRGSEFRITFPSETAYNFFKASLGAVKQR